MKNTAIAFFVLLITACGSKKTANEAMPSPEIPVASPVRQDVTYTYEYPAYLEAEQTVSLIARVPGFLEQVLFTPGQNIKTGQLLFVIEPKPYSDRVNAANAGLKSAEAQLAYAKASYEKMKEAVKNKAVSEIDYIQAESGYNSALASVENARAELNTAEINLAYCYIKAPFDGRISRNMIDRGNYVGSSAQSSELGSAYKDRKMFAYFNMAYPEYTTLVSPGGKGQSKDSIVIKDVADPGRQWRGYLDYAAPNVDLQTGTVTVRAVIDNPEQELLSGMYVKIIVPYKQVRNALLIPESSIGTNQSGRYVYTVDAQNTVKLTPVKVGILEPGGLRQISSGITKDEKYIADALMSVRPGMKITPVTQK